MDVFGYSQQLVTTTDTILYTCPVRDAVDVGSVSNVVADVQGPNVQTQITSIVVTNYSVGAQTFELFLTEDATSETHPIDLIRLIVSDHSLAADETIILSLGLVLSAGNTIWISASANAALTVTLNRIEVS